MEDILVNGVTEILKPLISSISQQITLAWGVKDDLRKLKEILESIQALITSAEEKQVNDATVRLWLRRLKDVVYDVDDVMDEFSYETMRRHAMGSGFKHKVQDFVSPSNPLVFYSKMSRKISGINKRLDEIYKENVRYSLNASSIHDEQTRELRNRLTSSVVDDSLLLGRDGAKSEIVNILSDKWLPSSSNSSQQEKISILSILGMGGLGKTSLAQLVYNDESIGKYFQLKMWVCISDDFNVYKILQNILESITGGACGDLLNFDVLVKKVKESMTGKRYLLVLDDLWNEDAEDWEKLKNILIGGGFGSKILVTTRNQKVADVVGGAVHNLKKLSDVVCWSIIEKKVMSQGGAGLSPEMISIGRDIAEKCDGLPLAANSLGSLMCSKRNERDWVSIASNNDLWSTPEHKKVISILKLSYDNLPWPVKQCFSYCCIFPKDWEINREILIRLWMAEGFLSPSSGGDNISLEDIGNEYFEHLVWSSFFQDVQKDAELGDITSCKMHDLVHDLASSVLDPNEFRIANVRDDKEDLSEVRRVQLLFDKRQSSVASPKVLSNAGKLRTIVALNPNNTSHINWLFGCRRLRVLCPLRGWARCSLSSGCCMSCLVLCELCSSSWIPKLKHLRYLDLTLNNISFEVSLSLNHCYNLQTLVLGGCKIVPRCGYRRSIDFGSLKNLRHLDISCSRIQSIPENIGSLEHLSFLDVSETPISKLPDSITCISRLRTLRFNGCRNLKALPREIGALTRLRCLDLEDTSIKELPESCISNLCNLEIVKLNYQCQLPKEIKNWPKLRIFTHFGRNGVMPRGIERLTFLEALYSYNVSNNNNGIEELAGLNFLEVLSIQNLENVSGGNECAERAKLKDKQHLHWLELGWWGSTGDDDNEEVRNSRCVKDTRVLEGLQPHSNLKNLSVDGFSGVNLPKWMMRCSLSNCLPNLVELKFSKLDNCEKLPALGMLPFLRDLEIQRMKSIKCLGEEFYYQPDEEESSSSNITKGFSLFPSLVKLKIELENLEEWVAPPPLSSCFPSLEKLSIHSCKRLRITPPITSFSSLNELVLEGTNDNAVNSLFNRRGVEGCLTSLTSIDICNSPDVIYLPPLGVLLQHNTQKLLIWNCSSFQGFLDDDEDLKNNNSLGSLRIVGCPALISLPDLRLFTCIQSLELGKCPGLTSLPDLLLLTCIRSLHLEDCPGLTALPDLRLCTSLRKLTIFGCSKLNKQTVPYDLKKSLMFLEILKVDFIQRDEGGPDVSYGYYLTNLMEKKKKKWIC